MHDPYPNIPDNLKELDNWCLWKYEERDGKKTKIPFCAYTGNFAKSNDSSTWADYDSAISVLPSFDGLGFFFDGEHYGVDIDSVPSEIDRFYKGDHHENIVSEFIYGLETYAEVSPSGNGIHLIARGHLPSGGRRKGDVEMYDTGRFFTMTGKHIGDFYDIADDCEANRINFLHAKYIGQDEINIEDLSETKTQKEVTTHDLTVDEIIDIMMKSKKSKQYEYIFKGGWEDIFPNASDHSSVDMSFANDLAFYTAGDIKKMDEIFRQTSLMRKKWDEKRGKLTYGQITLQRAIDDVTDHYKPQESGFKLKIKSINSTSEEEKKRYSYDDMGNAQRFLESFGNRVKFVYQHNFWYYYSGKVWVTDEIGKIQEAGDYIANQIRFEPIYVSDVNDEELVEKAQKAKDKHVKYTRSNNGKEKMFKEVKHHVSVTPGEFDRGMYHFNTQNGYIDLATGSLYEHNKERLFTRISNAEYKPNTDAPTWSQFISEIFLGDNDLIDYVQRAVGYTMSGSTEEHKMFVLLGDGRNGKSVFLSILYQLFGSYAMNTQTSTFGRHGTSSDARPDLARLQGARFVTTNEPNRGFKFDEGTLKQITGGDPLTARYLYGRHFEYNPEFKIWMATNHKPQIDADDYGMWRRMVVIPFDYHVPEEKVDKHLVNKLQKEIDGILAWAYRGFEKWRVRDLDNEPKVIRQLREDYRTEMDVLEQFKLETLQITRNEYDFVPTKEIWESFKTWVKDSEEDNDFTRRTFTAELKKKYGLEIKVKDNTRSFVGLKRIQQNSPYFSTDNIIEWKRSK